MSEDTDRLEVVETRTRVLTKKVNELKQGKDEMFLALVQATQAQVALEEIRLALNTDIEEDDYEEIVAQAVDAIVEFRVNGESYRCTDSEPFMETRPTTWTTYDAERLRYLSGEDD
jgi:hypothetical protein